MAEPLRPDLAVALYQPDIAQNAGTILRMCACLSLGAEIVEPAGFPTDDRRMRRAGMDYLDHVAVRRHVSYRAFDAWRRAAGRRLVLLTTKADAVYYDFAFAPGDILMVGRESAGAPESVHADADARLRAPMAGGLRSLNVAVAAAMVVGEAIRQLRFVPGRTAGMVNEA